ncbi:hypothetical protein B0H19DRAFT_1148055, partial [Mycena capillaripes]
MVPTDNQYRRGDNPRIHEWILLQSLQSPPVLSQACLLTDLPTEFLRLVQLLSPLVEPEDVEHRSAQRQDLCSLSQSCNVLRSVCLPFLWARFDISTSRNSDHLGRRTGLGPRILSCIGSVHISTENWSIPQQERMSILPEFLDALPNLRAVRMYHVNRPTIGRTLCSALANCCFPTPTKTHLPRLGALVGVRLDSTRDLIASRDAQLTP